MRTKTNKQAKSNKLNNVKDIVVLNENYFKFVPIIVSSDSMVFGSNTANAWKADLKSMLNNFKAVLKRNQPTSQLIN